MVNMLYGSFAPSSLIDSMAKTNYIVQLQCYSTQRVVYIPHCVDDNLLVLSPILI